MGSYLRVPRIPAHQLSGNHRHRDGPATTRFSVVPSDCFHSDIVLPNRKHTSATSRHLINSTNRVLRCWGHRPKPGSEIGRFGLICQFIAFHQSIVPGRRAKIYLNRSHPLPHFPVAASAPPQSRNQTVAAWNCHASEVHLADGSNHRRRLTPMAAHSWRPSALTATYVWRQETLWNASTMTQRLASFHSVPDDNLECSVPDHDQT